MSLPTIPDITPQITLDRCKTIDLLLSSIAMEEIGLSHILNAEAEKLQAFLKKSPCDFYKYLAINDSINKTLRTVVKSQILLQFKLEEVVTLDYKSCCPPPHPKKPCKCKDQDGKDCKKKDCVEVFDSSLCYCPNKKNKNCNCPKCKPHKKSHE
ncbi:hypothetical protein NST62_11485 [Ureibacillus sp. FSL K6-8385]|uniref:Uncharacterized protein n=1 Tax=Ureibacillus terrenus TaxID=118246 RepID=A0A540V3C8_9BACL|nr:hypothetical protein [Ureibacillus terrenus]MED3663020.1 hypothetical protein [Ureibacillus terrenus]MED3765025.1 hypothetical protein [Ureibacillus terrenus]TQE91239.1 hypothetical protein FKZ59_06235 [Ureibacillus terrenus]